MDEDQSPKIPSAPPGAQVVHVLTTILLGRKDEPKTVPAAAPKKLRRRRVYLEGERVKEESPVIKKHIGRSLSGPPPNPPKFRG